MPENSLTPCAVWFSVCPSGRVRGMAVSQCPCHRGHADDVRNGRPQNHTDRGLWLMSEPLNPGHPLEGIGLVRA